MHVLPPPTNLHRRAILWSTAGVTLCWSILAVAGLAERHAGGEVSGGRFTVLLAHAGMGLTHLGIGAWVATRITTTPGLLFGLYGACTAIHWTGPILPADPVARASLLALFFVVSSSLGQALFLHLALGFPPQSTERLGRKAMAMLYGPVALAALLAIVLTAESALGAKSGILEAAFTMLAIGLPNLYGAAAVVLLIRHALARRREGQVRTDLRPLPPALILALAPYLAAEIWKLAGNSLPGGLDTDPYVLGFTLIPVFVGRALLRSRRWSAAVR